MTTEYFIDRISNVSVQGSVISIDLGRLIPKAEDKKTFTLEDRVTITLTGQNFISLVTTLNESVKAIAERQKNKATTNTDETSNTANPENA